MTLKHLIIGGIIGVALVLVISIAGCGDVTLDTPHADGGAGAVEVGAEMRGDGAAGAEMTKLDGGAAGAGGIGGAAGTDAGGAAGAPGRPLGAGCSLDNQCGSGICATAIDGSHTCCDGIPDACTTCVGGYKVPRSDGTGCGPEMCDGTDRNWHLCMNGVCTAEVVHCAAALCDRAGNKICPGNTTQMPGCSLEDNPCFCYDAAGSGHISYPCP